MSWIADYLLYTKRQESPIEFHTWVALASAATALARNVWLERRAGGVTHATLYPGQLMICLVGGSGRVRKTTAVNHAVKFIEHIGRPIISGKSSPEAFLDQLDPGKTGNPTSVLVESELTVFVSKQSYTEPIVEILIKLYDADKKFPFFTRHGGAIVIPKPCLTVIAATTPESLGSRIPVSAHGAGFMSRIIFVYAKTTDRIESLSDVEDTDVDPVELAAAKAAEQRLYVDITKLSKLAGPFTFTPKGKKWFDSFYKKWVTSPQGQGEGYPARRPEHLLRCAMIITATKDFGLQLDEDSLRAADKLLYDTEANFDKAFAYVGTVYAKDRQRLIEFITSKAGKCSIAEIYAALYAYFPDTAILRRALLSLKEAGVLSQTFSTTTPPVEYWNLVGFTFKL